MEEENINIMDKIEKIEALRLIKSEAEMVLDETLSSESVIISKANNIFQIIIVIASSLIAYMVSGINTGKYNIHILIVSVFFCLISGYAVFLLMKIIYPGTAIPKGAKPSSLLQKDIIIKDWEEFLILKNRINSLEIAINENKLSQAARVKSFKCAIEVLLLGISISFIYSLVVLLRGSI